MSGCENCSGSCEKCNGCSGCGGALELTEGEVKMLLTLAQIPFLPVARRADDMTPVYLEEEEYTREQYSAVLMHLEKKGLISIDYDKPLSHCDVSGYAAYPVKGSFALTGRGQQVLELLQVQGIG